MTSTEARMAPHGASSSEPLNGWSDAPRRGRGFSLRTLIVLRWLTIIGQSAAILTAHQGLHFPLPLWPCLIVIAISAAVNVGAMARVRRLEASLPDGRTTAIHLGFDIFQLGVLLGLTGGLENPFCLLLVAPVTIAAAALPARQALMLGVLALIAVGVLFFWSEPLPWRPHENFHLPTLYRLGMAMALVTGVVFTAGYAWRVAADAEKLELALATTQDVLQREQRLAALGGLAAAAAHELGTPLATIQVVAKELQRASAPDSDAAEDAALILQQAERCRGILTQLSQQPEGDDALYADVSLKALLEEVVEPHRGFDLAFDVLVKTPPGQPAPRVRRMPEVIHGLSTLVENAADFAKTTVRVQAVVDAGWIEIEILDDGPGFAGDILPRLGEPYVTSRPQGKARQALAAQIAAAARPSKPRTTVEPPIAPSQGGMGLGFFIARTLLERTGGSVSVGQGLPQSEAKAAPRGARVAVRWARPALEVAA
ncbi:MULTISPECIES: ActS/PrrB/RegB family redox-sensitive histidine kinase [Brevundimonas]|uniref:ActS/PrrB/RegB family redox-sensitive histidine kinase n=1 Tax=Brevundimonas TaxID=41275 RepID=UPI0021009348|nr:MULTISPECIES: ActS/PrrB/RegB family redox-sensitive histidine kinase [Brevundimonas]